MEQEASASGGAAALRGQGVMSDVRQLLATSLYTNAFYLWASMVVIAISGFLFWALAAALYTPDDVGLGAASISALTLLALLSTIGLGMGLVRFLPQAGEQAPILINSSFAAAALAAVLLSSIYLAGLPIWSPELLFLREQPLYLLGFVLFAVLITLAYIQDQAFVALRTARYVLAKTILLNCTRVVLPLLLVVFLAAYGITASFGLASLVGFAAGIVMLRRAQPGYEPALALARQPILQMIPFSFVNHIAEIALVLPSLVLPIMVVHVLNPASGAYFFVGWFLSQVFAGISIYAAMSLFAEGSHDQASLARLTRHALGLTLLAATTVAIVILLVGGKILLAFGRDYSAEATGLLHLVALASIPAAITNVYLGVERVKRGLKALAVIPLLVAAITLALSYLLLPRLGIAGAGVGLLVGQCIGAAIAIVQLPRRLRLGGRPA